jgi:hypothetical protein
VRLNPAICAQGSDGIRSYTGVNRGQIVHAVVSVDPGSAQPSPSRSFTPVLYQLLRRCFFYRDWMDMYMRFKGFRVPVVFAVGVAVVGSVVAVAASGSTPHHGISSVLRQRFAVFGHARASGRFEASNAGTSAYPGVAGMLRNMSQSNDQDNQGEGLDVAGTREVTTSGGPVWLVPGSSGVCIVIPSPTNPVGAEGTCGTVSQASRGGVSATLFNNGEQTTFGLAPNGVASVSAASSGPASPGASADRASSVARVVGNAYILKTRGAPGSRRVPRVVQRNRSGRVIGG